MCSFYVPEFFRSQSILISRVFFFTFSGGGEGGELKSFLQETVLLWPWGWGIGSEKNLTFVFFSPSPKKAEKIFVILLLTNWIIAHGFSRIRCILCMNKPNICPLHCCV